MLEYIAPAIALLISGFFIYNCIKHVINRKKQHERNKQHITRNK